MSAFLQVLNVRFRGGLRAVPTVAVTPSSGAASCLSTTSRGRRAEPPSHSFLQQRPSNWLRTYLTMFYKTKRTTPAGVGRTTRTLPARRSRWAWPRSWWHWVQHVAQLLRKSGHLRIAGTGNLKLALTHMSIEYSIPKYVAKPSRGEGSGLAPEVPHTEATCPIVLFLQDLHDSDLVFVPAPCVSGIQHSH